MRVIGVLDLLSSRAVLARGGVRERYLPVAHVSGLSIEPGDAVALARAYLERCGVTELYAADLDAIMHGTPQEQVVSSLTAVGAPLWLDAGISTPDSAARAIALGAARVVVGLETLISYESLGAICRRVGSDRVVFSLDLRGGQPVAERMQEKTGDSASRIARRAVSEGVTAMIVLDLARVGARAGLDLASIGRVRRAAPDVMLLAGGGVRGEWDIERLADVGCDGALVGTALLSGDVKGPGIAKGDDLRRLARTRSSTE